MFENFAASGQNAIQSYTINVRRHPNRKIMNTADILVKYANLLSEAPKIALKENTSLFKARSCLSEAEAAKIEKDPSNNLLANPLPAEADGRFHSKGEYALYLSSCAETATAEVKKENTRWIITGEFSTCRCKTVFSFLPEDYKLNFFPPDNPVHQLSIFLNGIAHEQNNYSETKKFVDVLKRKGLISDPEKEVFIIRYQSVKNPQGKNYFMCGAIENSKLLGLEKARPRTDFGLLQFVGHKKISIP